MNRPTLCKSFVVLRYRRTEISRYSAGKESRSYTEYLGVGQVVRKGRYGETYLELVNPQNNTKSAYISYYKGTATLTVINKSLLSRRCEVTRTIRGAKACYTGLYQSPKYGFDKPIWQEG